MFLIYCFFEGGVVSYTYFCFLFLLFFVFLNKQNPLQRCRQMIHLLNRLLLLMPRDIPGIACNSPHRLLGLCICYVDACAECHFVLIPVGCKNVSYSVRIPHRLVVTIHTTLQTFLRSFKDHCARHRSIPALIFQEHSSGIT